MREVVIATKNQGKVKEFEHIFKTYGVKVKSLLDFDESIEIVEDGQTFEENALIKAREIANKYHVLVVADDSGLEVDALQGRPGVYSARYDSDARDDFANMKKVLKELKGVPNHARTARFVCALAIVNPNGDEHVVRGECEGVITTECRGNEGFGYDPIFYLPSAGKTMAQIPSNEKNVLSHRAEAFKKLEAMLMNLV
ncbi:MAG: XTP/dITP diphosphatase [Turicibacter sp.]